MALPGDSPSAVKLTQYLLSVDIRPPRQPYSAAIQHPFLTQAGNGTLPLLRLALWLSQDRIYAAHAYPRFIGSLISRIVFHPTDSIDGPRERRLQHILATLVKCLNNIVKEVTFFRDTAEKWGLDMQVGVERKGTRDYTAEMARISESLEEGLIFLWAMERVYFDAWSYVHHLQSESHHRGTPADTTGSQASRSFASNWSSPEFAAFVEELAELVDNLGTLPGTRAWSRAEEIWLRVVELEVGFWPEDGEEVENDA